MVERLRSIRRVLRLIPAADHYDLGFSGFFLNYTSKWADVSKLWKQLTSLEVAKTNQFSFHWFHRRYQVLHIHPPLHLYEVINSNTPAHRLSCKYNILRQMIKTDNSTRSLATLIRCVYHRVQHALYRGHLSTRMAPLPAISSYNSVHEGLLYILSQTRRLLLGISILHFGLFLCEQVLLRPVFWNEGKWLMLNITKNVIIKSRTLFQIVK